MQMRMNCEAKRTEVTYKHCPGLCVCGRDAHQWIPLSGASSRPTAAHPGRQQRLFLTVNCVLGQWPCCHSVFTARLSLKRRNHTRNTEQPFHRRCEIARPQMFVGVIDLLN